MILEVQDEALADVIRLAEDYGLHVKVVYPKGKATFTDPRTGEVIVERNLQKLNAHHLFRIVNYIVDNCLEKKGGTE